MFTILETLVQYGLYTNILDKNTYKKIASNKQFDKNDRLRISIDLRNVITAIIFDVDIMKALPYSNISIISELNKQKKKDLLDVFNMLNNYMGSASLQISWTVQHGIDKYFKKYEEN